MENTRDSGQNQWGHKGPGPGAKIVREKSAGDFSRMKEKQSTHYLHGQ